MIVTLLNARATFFSACSWMSYYGSSQTSKTKCLFPFRSLKHEEDIPTFEEIKEKMLYMNNLCWLSYIWITSRMSIDQQVAMLLSILCTAWAWLANSYTIIYKKYKAPIARDISYIYNLVPLYINTLDKTVTWEILIFFFFFFCWLQSAKNGTSSYYMSGSSTLPRGGALLRPYSPASGVLPGPNAVAPGQPKALGTPGESSIYMHYNTRDLTW